MTVEGSREGGRLRLLSPGEERLQGARGKKTFEVSKDSKSRGRAGREGPGGKGVES